MSTWWFPAFLVLTHYMTVGKGVMSLRLTLLVSFVCLTVGVHFIFSAFAEAKKCLNKAHEGKCNFDESTQKAAMFDEDNPFCESGKDPQKSGVSWAQATILEVFISSIVVLFAVP